MQGLQFSKMEIILIMHVEIFFISYTGSYF